MKKITIVIPVYNEETALKNMTDDFRNLLNDFGILFVNDGSKDNSFDIIKSNNFNVISNPYNMGYGASIKRGVRNAQTEYVAIMDADFNTDLKIFMKFRGILIIMIWLLEQEQQNLISLCSENQENF